MKTNLNIAYLNGAEGMIKKGAASSGGSSGSGDSIKIEYYKIDWDKLYELGFDKNDNSMQSFSMEIKSLLFSSHTAKIVINGNIFAGINVSGGWALMGYIYYAIAISFAFPIKILSADSTETIFSSVKELVASLTNTDWLIPITEEEYYNTDGLIPV